MTQPTSDDWKRLYELAAEVKALAPWEWMTETDVFGVQDPETGRLGFVSVMGQLGDHYAVALYLGAEGLYGLWTMEEYGESMSVEMLLSVPQLQLSFEDRDILTQRDRDLIKSLGLRFRGRNAWPMFRSYRPGFMPWHLEADEVRFLTLALEQALEVLPRVRENPALIEPQDEESTDYLVRVAQKSPQGLVWTDQIIQVNPPEPRMISLTIDEVMVKRLKRLPLANATFEIDVTMAPWQTREGPNDRPRLTFILLIVDHNRGMVLGHDLLVAEPDIESVWSRIPLSILKTLDHLQVVPRQFVSKNTMLLQVLSILASELNFELYQAEELPMLEEALSFLFARF